MAQATVRVLARVIALPDKIEEVKSLLLQLVEPTRKEEGCINYILLQNSENAAEFSFIEEWENNTVLYAHLQSSHVQQIATKVQSLIEGDLDIRRYDLLK